MPAKLQKVKIENEEDANTLIKRELHLTKRAFNNVVDKISPKGGTFSDYAREAINEKLERDGKN